MSKPPSHPVALVTGASRGIGKAIALALAKEGFDLILTCKNNLALLEAVAIQAMAFDVRCSAHVLDGGDYEAHEAFFTQHVARAFGRLDLVVNNAGVAYMGLLTDMSQEDWRHLMATNLDSLFHTSKFAVPMMVAQKSGVILNISSIWGNDGASCEVAYSASKGAMNSFTKALAKELAPSGIRVNALACGAIETEMNAWMRGDDKTALEGNIGLGRMGSPEEIAETVVFLASEKASYITGQIITVDGGML